MRYRVPTKRGCGCPGFTAGLGLLYSPGKGAVIEDELRTLALMLRIFVNDLDSVRILFAMVATDPTAMPLSVLLGVPFTPPEAMPAATLH